MVFQYKSTKKKILNVSRKTNTERDHLQKNEKQAGMKLFYPNMIQVYNEAPSSKS